MSPRAFCYLTLAMAAHFADATSARAASQPIVLNASFETGTTSPDGWVLSGGKGAWEQGDAADGRRFISVTGTGDDSNSWTSTGPRLAPARLYRLRFKARSRGASGGTAIAGLTTNNRDFNAVPAWTPFSFVFRTPDSGAGALRFGQWHVTGTVDFDDVCITPVVPVYDQDASIGDGEAKGDKAYSAETRLGGEGSNFSRCLHLQTAAFNSDRWVLGTGSSVTYWYPCSFGGVTAVGPSASPRVTLDVSYYVSGECVVEARYINVGAGVPADEAGSPAVSRPPASPPGTSNASVESVPWTVVGTIGNLGEKTFVLPPPPDRAVNVEVRFHAEPLDGRAPELQVNRVYYKLGEDRPAVFYGETHYAEISVDEASDVSVARWGELAPGNGDRMTLRMGPQPAIIRWSVEGQDGKVHASGHVSAPSAPGQRKVEVPYSVAAGGPTVLNLAIERGGKTVFAGRLPFTVSLLNAADYGHRMSRNGDLWWAESGFKIGMNRPAPGGDLSSAKLNAARGETAPFQLVFQPHHGVSATVSALPLKGPRGLVIPADAVQISCVENVRIDQPSDSKGSRGWWPDPLTPFHGVLALRPDERRVLWISIRVPEDASPGDYRGEVHLKSGSEQWSAPIMLHVWNFALPRVSPVRSCMGISPGDLRRYHNLKTDADLRTVWDLYMQDFAAHRLCPANAMSLDPIRVSFEGEGASRRAHMNTTAFDIAAHRYLDGMGFTAFSLPVEGMGGGTFFERTAGEFGGFKAGTPEFETLWSDYIRQLAAHLRERGWLSKAYVYWFDEPAERDFPFVREGMERLKRDAPDLVRLLTKEPRPELEGSVDLWCPILNAYEADRAHVRQKAGEQVWWYICCGPKAPYPGEFIDRPGTDLREWVWETWRNQVQGLLIWETTYWTSNAAYPKDPQDPWKDPMSWVSGYGTGAGVKQPWGNGDGRFLYPPTVEERAAGKPILRGPCDSIRWELLAKGLDDFDYFHILSERIDAAAKAGVPDGRLNPLRALLDIPPDVAHGLTAYSPDPHPMEAHREEIARAIEGLAGGS